MTYNFENLKILLVEDNVPMLNLIKSVLHSFGVGTVETALNGEEGFEVFCRTNPDLIITDWMMSPCDGTELIRLIRNHKKSPNKFIPVILMTGFSSKKRVFSARDEGVTEFMTKPFNARDLYRRLYQIIEKPRKFVKSEDFFGPDRRRKGRGEYAGDLRRNDDDPESVTHITSTDYDDEDIDFI